MPDYSLIVKYRFDQTQNLKDTEILKFTSSRWHQQNLSRYVKLCVMFTKHLR